jgi:hypothetical protein
MKEWREGFVVSVDEKPYWWGRVIAWFIQEHDK